MYKGGTIREAIKRYGLSFAEDLVLFYPTASQKRLFTSFSVPSDVIILLFLSEINFKFGGGNFSCK